MNLGPEIGQDFDVDAKFVFLGPLCLSLPFSPWLVIALVKKLVVTGCLDQQV